MSLKEKILLHEAKGFKYESFLKALEAICNREGITLKKEHYGFTLVYSLGPLQIFTNKFETTPAGYKEYNVYESNIDMNNAKQFLLKLKGFNKRAKSFYALILKTQKILEAVKKKDPSISVLFPKSFRLSSFRDNKYINHNVQSKIYGPIDILIEIDTKSIIFKVDGKTKEIKSGADLKELFVKKSKKDIQKIEVLDTIKRDLERLPFRSYMKDDEANIYKNLVSFGMREVGDWRYNHAAHGGDDDYPQLTSKSAKEISSKFKEWIRGKEWKKYVKSFSIEPSEKAWLYFNIEVK